MRTWLGLAASLVLTATLPSVAHAQHSGVAAPDGNGYPSYFAVSQGSTLSTATENARSTCYSVVGEACKAISDTNGPWFAIIRCFDDGPHVHMSSGNSPGAALSGARTNARSFGRSNCQVVMNDLR